MTPATCRSELVPILGLLLSAACGDGRAADWLDGGTADQLADSPTATADADADATEPDAAPSQPPFVAIAPCLRPEQYVTGPMVVTTLTSSYSPACLRVGVGALVTIQASVEHPLEPRALGSAGNPIPQQQASTRVVFPAAGFFAYQCPEHVDVGMLGVVWVTPSPSP